MKNFIKTVVLSLVLITVTAPAFAVQGPTQLDEYIVSTRVMTAINELRTGNIEIAMKWLKKGEEYAREHNVKLSEDDVAFLRVTASNIKKARGGN